MECALAGEVGAEVARQGVGELHLRLAAAVLVQWLVQAVAGRVVSHLGLEAVVAVPHVEAWKLLQQSHLEVVEAVAVVVEHHQWREMVTESKRSTQPAR